MPIAPSSPTTRTISILWNYGIIKCRSARLYKSLVWYSLPFFLLQLPSDSVLRLCYIFTLIQFQNVWNSCSNDVIMQPRMVKRFIPEKGQWRFWQQILYSTLLATTSTSATIKSRLLQNLALFSHIKSGFTLQSCFKSSLRTFDSSLVIQNEQFSDPFVSLIWPFVTSSVR